MIDILEELYNGRVDAVHHKMSPKYRMASDKEIEIYNQIKNIASPEIQDLLEQLMNANDKTSEQLALERYKIGFKTGLLMGLEINRK